MTSNPRSDATAAGTLPRPVQALREGVGRLPGAGALRGAFDTVLGTVGAVPPRSRRLAAYAGAGLLGAAGVVEWPVAAAGAAVVWLTQPRPGDDGHPPGPDGAAPPPPRPGGRGAGNRRLPPAARRRTARIRRRG